MRHSPNDYRWCNSSIPYAVLIRYPGMTATVVEAKEAVHALRRMRTILRRKLGMS
jgi:hypothetical protein